MPRKTDRHLGPAGERRRRRSARLWAADRLLRSPADRRRRGQVLSRPARGRPARPRGLGDRVDQALHPQHHASRRAVAFRLHHGRRQARHHHRRGAARMVLAAGVKLDFRHFPDGYVATARDVEAELERIGHTLSPLEIVVVNTSAGAAYGRPDYVAKGCGMGREATLYLLERGVRVTGTDGWSWDAPFVHTKEKYLATGDAEPDLGGPQGRPRDRLLPPREAAQSRGAAGHRLHGVLLSGQGPRRFRRLDARGRDHRMKWFCDALCRVAARLTPSGAAPSIAADNEIGSIASRTRPGRTSAWTDEALSSARPRPPPRSPPDPRSRRRPIRRAPITLINPFPPGGAADVVGAAVRGRARADPQAAGGDRDQGRRGRRGRRPVRRHRQARRLHAAGAHRVDLGLRRGRQAVRPASRSSRATTSSRSRASSPIRWCSWSTTSSPTRR